MVPPWWHCKYSFSLSKIKDQYNVTYNGSNGNFFVIDKPNGSTTIFKESADGLYYHDNSHNETNDDSKHNMILVTRVNDNANPYSNVNYQAQFRPKRIKNPWTSQY